MAYQMTPERELEALKANLELLEEMARMQREDGHYDYSPSSYGFANGLILAHAIMEGKRVEDAENEFCKEPEEWLFEEGDQIQESLRRHFNAFREDINITTIRSLVVASRIRIWQIMSAIPKTSRPQSMAYTALENSRMALGKGLKLIGCEDPYEIAENKRKHQGSKEIAPTADVSEEELEVSEDLIEAADFLRKEIHYVIEKLKTVHKMLPRLQYDFWAIEWFTEAIKQIEYSRMYYGLELARIRDEAVEGAKEVKEKKGKK